jgi:hypothetical protein
MTYRFLLMDGRTIDVRAIQADSYLTDAVLKKTGAKGISGVTTLDRPTDEKGKGDERVGPTV